MSKTNDTPEMTDEDREYEQYEKDCERLRAENKKHLSAFEKWLTDSGLAKKTIKAHLENAEFYISHYLLRDDGDCEARNIPDGAWHVGGFFDWCIYKSILWSADSVRKMGGSLKKFYLFMLEQGIVTQDDYDDLKETIKDGMEDWLDTINNGRGDW